MFLALLVPCNKLDLNLHRTFNCTIQRFLFCVNFICFIFGMFAENSAGMRPPTLNIFPSQPMHVDPSSTKVYIYILYYFMYVCIYTGILGQEVVKDVWFFQIIARKILRFLIEFSMGGLVGKCWVGFAGEETISAVHGDVSQP